MTKPSINSFAKQDLEASATFDFHSVEIKSFIEEYSDRELTRGDISNLYEKVRDFGLFTIHITLI